MASAIPAKVSRSAKRLGAISFPASSRKLTHVRGDLPEAERSPPQKSRSLRKTVIKKESDASTISG